MHTINRKWRSKEQDTSDPSPDARRSPGQIGKMDNGAERRKQLQPPRARTLAHPDTTRRPVYSRKTPGACTLRCHPGPILNFGASRTLAPGIVLGLHVHSSRGFEWGLQAVAADARADGLKELVFPFVFYLVAAAWNDHKFRAGDRLEAIKTPLVREKS